MYGAVPPETLAVTVPSVAEGVEASVELPVAVNASGSDTVTDVLVVQLLASVIV